MQRRCSVEQAIRGCGRKAKEPHMEKRKLTTLVLDQNMHHFHCSHHSNYKVIMATVVSTR